MLTDGAERPCDFSPWFQSQQDADIVIRISVLSRPSCRPITFGKARVHVPYPPEEFPGHAVILKEASGWARAMLSGDQWKEVRSGAAAQQVEGCQGIGTTIWRLQY